MISMHSYADVAVARLLNFEVAGIEICPCDFQPKPVPGFVTFYDPGWSILQLRTSVAEREEFFSRQTWYNDQPFVNLEEPPRYRQLRMTPVPDSFCRTFAEQQSLLPPDDEVPSARVVIMGMVIHFLATGERLFSDHWIWCCDTDMSGSRVLVGSFGSGGFHVSSYWDFDRSRGLGLASARKC